MVDRTRDAYRYECLSIDRGSSTREDGLAFAEALVREIPFLEKIGRQCLVVLYTVGRRHNKEGGRYMIPQSTFRHYHVAFCLGY
jgi:hypothetical protein